ncbi:MAG: DUF922 domain-containing protein [Magnetococcales bacterium]|nr:DUF922 domain-containing protein [Magnetococcales bacterium]
MKKKLMVNLTWGPRNKNAEFRVDAADLENALRILVGRDEWGLFKGNIQYKWKADANKNVTSVNLMPTYTITMPRWTGYTRQPQECKDAWDIMWRALYEHEDGHRKIFELGTMNLVSGLEEIESQTSVNVDNFLKRKIQDMQNEQDQFDRETDHGRSRGVELTVTDHCRKKEPDR